jgi:antitoxin component YwqK of YwqJK toxin-antitoxin module
MSYLKLLDDACLFSLLVRLHYPDLINICKAYNKLYKISVTPWFQSEWVAYNIKVITECGYDRQAMTHRLICVVRHICVDRLGKNHGKSISYVESTCVILRSENYIHGKQNGLTTCYNRWEPSDEGADIRFDVNYTDGKKHGLCIVEKLNGTFKYQVFVDGLLNGLCRTHHSDGRRTFKEFVNGIQHGKYIKWFSNGAIHSKATKVNNQKTGRYVEFFNNGQKDLEYTKRDGQFVGSYKTWLRDGTLLDEIMY